MDDATRTSSLFLFFEVPWLGGTHDGFPLLSTQHYIQQRRARYPRAPHTACQLQSLLIFGVLESALEIKIAERQLLRKDTLTGGMVVAQEGVMNLLTDWRQRTLQIQTWEDASHWVFGVKKAIMGGSMMFEMATTNQAFERLPQLAGDSLVAAQLYAQAACVLDAVYATCSAIIGLWSSKWQLPTLEQPRLGAFASSLRPMIDKMVADGWCPFTLSILSEYPCVLSYAFTHPSHGSSSRGHATCSPINCATNNIDTSDYKPAHVSPDCTCAFLKPSLNTVLDALTADTIPVVQLSPDGESIITSIADQTSFVALSHVWADGLGSTTEVGLPQCQLRRIAPLVQSLNPRGAFWMDALCVPSVREQRKKAIALMAQTYRDASHVLVLDAQIRTVPFTAGRVEKMFRILTAGWMQRLWTFQEGVLARRVLFEFAGGLVDMDKLEEGFDIEYLSNAVHRRLKSKLISLRRFRSSTSPLATPNFTLTDVFSSLQWRSTSRPSDETLAVAGLLNVDAGVLVALPSEERLPHLLRELGAVDDSLPFSNIPRLSAPGFRWAPSTLMGHTPARLSGTSRPLAVCTDAGLLAEYFAFCLHETVKFGFDATTPPSFFLHDVTSGEDYIAQVGTVNGHREETTWECNMLLFVHDHLGGHLTSGVAALRYGMEEEAGNPRHLCTYQAYVVVKDVLSLLKRKTMPDDMTGIVRVQGHMKRMKVRCSSQIRYQIH
ncbi:hypothetical protein C2E23DRAFT_809444 [Lenzites betulinus]|nr:hypothetical protein C2E23DRAFT_809444 [Lenzites betulinus]